MGNCYSDKKKRDFEGKDNKKSPSTNGNIVNNDKKIDDSNDKKDISHEGVIESKLRERQTRISNKNVNI